MAHSQTPPSLETEARSLFASLEARCIDEGRADRLPQLGMARYELMSGHGSGELVEVPAMSFEAATSRLIEVLTHLASRSTDLWRTLGYTRARDLLMESWEAVPTPVSSEELSDQRGGPPLVHP